MSQPSSQTVRKWRELVDLLVVLTGKGAISWKETADDGKFLASVSRKVVSIEREMSYRGVSPDKIIRVVISDADGKMIEAFDDEDLDGGTEDHQYYRVLDDLMKEISRKISGADKILDQLLSELRDKNEEIPF